MDINYKMHHIMKLNERTSYISRTTWVIVIVFYNGNEGSLIGVLRFYIKLMSCTMQMVIKDVCIMTNEQFTS